MRSLLFLVALACAAATNFYETLGVSSDADEATIKKAYRKLSLKYHPGACGLRALPALSPPRRPASFRTLLQLRTDSPSVFRPAMPAPADKNPGDATAQAKFTEVSRAYEVLTDGEKKSIYDLEGIEGLEQFEKNGGKNAPANPFDMFFGGGGGGGRRKGPDAQVEVEVTLEDLYNGGQRQARINRNIICPKCKGSGAKDGATSRCNACGGKGVRLVQQQMAPGFVVQMQETCSECGGKGQVFKTKCPHCDGRKVVPEEKTLTCVCRPRLSPRARPHSPHFYLPCTRAGRRLKKVWRRTQRFASNASRSRRRG
jgi:DnaJ-class molecular chaperone